MDSKLDSPETGHLTLRDAISAARAGDTIEFAGSLFAGSAATTITLASPLVVTRNLTIIGPGDAGTRAPVLQLTSSGRILQIISPATVLIAGMGFRGGSAPGGGAVLIDAGANTTFQGCDFSNNQATGGNSGGAILNRGTLTLDQCLVTNNTAANGGGVASFGKTQMVRCLIVANTTPNYGGGIYSSAADLWIESSTVSANTAGTGGGIAFFSSAKIANTATITAVTVMENVSAAQAGGLYVEGSGAIANVGGSIFARNVIVNNSGAQTPHDLATQKSGKINSADYNIVVKPGTTLSPYGLHDQIGIDPQVAPLAYNGGRTRTYAIGLSSPALDRGNPGFQGSLTATDQRGIARVWPAKGRVDVGAFEFAALLSCPPTFRAEATGSTTPVTLTSSLILPRGGATAVTWTVNGSASAPSVVTVPDDCEPHELNFQRSFAVGSTSVTVNVTCGTLNLSASTTVIVVDTAAPRITLLGDNPYYVECGSAYVDPGATAVDAADGPLPVSVEGAQLNTSVLGINTVTYRAVDQAGNQAEAQRTVVVRDTTPPVVTSVLPASVSLIATTPGTCSFPASLSSLGLTVTATDISDRSPTILYELAAPGGYSAISFPYAFPIGTTTLYVSARDASGNQSARQAVPVIVRDGVSPSIGLNGSDSYSLPLGTAFQDPGVTASDQCSPPVTVTSLVRVGEVVQSGGVDSCAPGIYVITYTATDSAGNSATVSRTVTVTANISLTAEASYLRTVDPALRTASIDLAQAVALNGMASACRSNLAFVVTVKPPAGASVTLTGLPGAPLPVYAFSVGTSAVDIKALLKTASGDLAVFATTGFSVVVTDPYGVTLTNVAWPLAIDLDPNLILSGGRLAGTVRQMIARAGESRWYKFRGPPGSRISVTLTNLPANFDVVLYGDIQQVFNQLLGLVGSTATADQKLALLGAEFAPEAYSPEAYSPEAYSPEAYAPEAYSPEAYSPEAYSPEAYSPEAYSPEAYSPEAYSPEAYSPEAYSPEAYSPEAYSPEAYASAQQRTVIGFSASPGTVGEGIRFATYSKSGEFYVRVRGQNGIYSTQAPFNLTIAIQQDLCSGVVDFTTVPTTRPSVAGTPSSLLLWDSARTNGTASEKAALGASLAAFASAANGIVVNLANDFQIAKLNAQADANSYCPIAKNLVAEAIRNLIQLHRQAAPTLSDITLLGNDDVIPFFRTNDKAMLASEANYFPPVRDGTQSQSSLRYAQVLSQDRYGSDCQVVLGTGPYDLPEIPVGRLVETAVEMKAYLDAYGGLFNGTASSGMLPVPKTGFVAGYDFLADSAVAIRDEFAAGLGSVSNVDALISPLGPAPAFGWTADQFRASFLGSRHDISYLAAHFSTGRALAADYTTRIRAQEIALSPVDLKYAIVLSAGCHSGYNTVDQDAIQLVTEQPDWAQAFARKNAIWIAGTGYQYGDTDFIEYTERLLLNVARALRTGSSPVAIGRAVVEAKRRYLADTALMRGIHEKTLLELSLYGLPMVKLNLPGARLSSQTRGSGVTGVSAVTGGPGATHGLKIGDLSFSPVLTRVDRTLDVVGSATTVTASYFTGSNGIVALPGEPVRPLESFNVSRPLDGFLRGVGFRSGDYVDLGGFVPFTGAPATETRGVHGPFSTEVFYPVRPWNLNQIGELCGASGISELNAFPTQFISDSATAATGTLRKYGRMQFTLFYCPEVSAAALANPPAINVVSSTTTATGVSFSVETAATSTAGVHEVWVTYTGLPGSPYYGRWQSLTLNGPANATGIGTWAGALTTAGGPLLFIVQAANGVGAVAQNTNFGRYFRSGTSTLDGVGAATRPTSLALIAPVPTAGAYRSTVAIQARLSDAAAANVTGKRIRFQIGSVINSAFTDTNGLATTNLVLNAQPGTYTVEASFAGDADYQGSSAGQPFTVTKMPTQLTLGSGAFVADPAHVVVNLRAIDGTPLKERTVLFIMASPGASPVVINEITDGAGQARLGSTTLPPATYTLNAYFGQPVTLPDNSLVALNDPLYAGSSLSSSLTVATSLWFHDEQAWVNYSDATAPGASADNLGLSKAEILASMSSTDPKFGPPSILASGASNSVTATLSAKLSGKTIAVGSVSLRVQANDNLHWRGDAVLNGSSVQLNVDWDGTGGSGKYHIWIYPPAGSGPLFKAAPALLQCELILGTGPGEHAAGGVSEIGGPSAPWTQQTSNSRVKSN